MKFVIEKKELSTITTLVYRAASSKNTIPVLSGLLLQVSPEQGITMTATDMEIGMKATSKDVEVLEEGTTLVNAHYFADFIKLLPDLPISVELNRETAKLSIHYGRSSGAINTYRDFEYPDLPLEKMEKRLVIPQNIIKEALRKTSFASATTHFRQVFTGVLFDILEGGELRLVASDTHRLAYYKYQMPEPHPQPFSFIIPTRTVNELMRLLEDSPEVMNIGLSDNNVIFYKDDIILLSRLIEGQYPNYEQVVPASFTTTIKVNSQKLLNTLERARTMPTDDKLKIQHVQLSFNENEAVFKAFSEIMGEIEEVIEEIAIDGDKEFKIAFNTNYFHDIARLLEAEGEDIIIQLSGSLGPALIKNPENDNYLYVLVPLRTTG